MSRRLSAAVLACAALAAGCGGGPGAVGRSYSRLPDLQHAMEDEGYVLVGRAGALGAGEKAKIAERIEGRDRVSFALQGGAPQEYAGFDGYDLLVIRLAGAAGGEMAVVFRSAEQRPPDAE